MSHQIKNTYSINKAHIMILRYLKRAVNNNSPYILLQFSGVKYKELEGQRPLRFANEAVKKGIPTIYAYLHTRDEPMKVIQQNDNLLVMPLKILDDFKHFIFNYFNDKKITKMFCIHFPYSSVEWLIPIAKQSNWTIIYDCMDLWKEFHPLGQAFWFNEQIESFVVKNSDIVIATNITLGNQLKRFGINDYSIIPNGVNPTRLNLNMPSKNFTKGEITIGFFGYISKAWFDWHLLIELAKRNPNWLFYIIWWGEKWPKTIPKNIISLGTVEHTELPKYASNWDLGLLNFKNIPLVHCCCPIKIYEYLWLGLPVVSADIPHLNKYPYVYTGTTIKEFEENIIKAYQCNPDRGIIDKFINNHTWEALFNNLLKTIDSHIKKARKDLS